MLSRQIAEAHGGTLTLENRAGHRGCIARLRLPAQGCMNYGSISRAPRGLARHSSSASGVASGPAPTARPPESVLARRLPRSIFHLAAPYQALGRMGRAVQPVSLLVGEITRPCASRRRVGSRRSAFVSGAALGYDKTLKDFDRTVVAIANSFAPFPEAAPAVAAGPATPPRPASLIASGIAVAPRRVLTTAGVEGCPDLRVAQAKARVVKADKAKGLALLEWEEARTPGPLALQASSQAGGEDLVVLSFSGPEPSLVATTAEAVSGGLVAPLQPGASGGAAFARSGALVGLIGALPATPRMVAGVVPPMAHPMIAAEAVASFLTDNGVALPAAAESEAQRSAGEIASTMGAAVLPIGCAR